MSTAEEVTATAALLVLAAALVILALQCVQVALESTWRMLGWLATLARGRVWHSVPFGDFPTGVGEELQGFVLEFDPLDGRTLELSLQVFVALGRARRMPWDFGRRWTVSRPLYWVRAFWSRPNRRSSLRARLGLGVVGLRWGCCPKVVYL